MADRLSYLQRHDIVYCRPALRPYDGLPVGTGDSGGLLYQSAYGLEMTVNHADALDYAPDGPMSVWAWEAEGRQTVPVSCGYLSIRASMPIFDWVYLEKFEQRLMLAAAEITGRAETPFSTAAWKVYAPQDPGVLALARQAGYEGGLFLSTLANLTHPASLLAAKELGADRVILPRELSIDEVKQISAACPEGLDLEMFIHGALCWCVSGRCYWSSYMGGKSGLRGRCVQPCRRVYKQRNHSGRFFSCLDLSLDVLAKTITDIPHLSCWKIEGRKKGPHYVYHVVTAYKMLRDNPDDPQARKDAEKILEMALGRPSTRAAIIETLFKRNYIRKEKKNLIATPTGVELIQIIHEELLKSAELTGIWEKKLREIEKKTYNAAQFLEELKQMVSEVVMSVLSDNSNRHITIVQAVQEATADGKNGKAAKEKDASKPKRQSKPRKKAAEAKPVTPVDGASQTGNIQTDATQTDSVEGQVCPLCGKGTIIKGKTAYGCSEWKNGCTFRQAFGSE